MRIPSKLLLLLFCLFQYAAASRSENSSGAKRSVRANLRTKTENLNQLKDADVAPTSVSRKLKEDQNGYDMSIMNMGNINIDEYSQSRKLKEDQNGYDMSNMNMDNINIDEYTQRPKELFSTPMSEWTTEDWIVFAIILALLSCFLSCLSKIGCGACNLLNCLTCYCCLSLCCGGADAGSYVAADSLC